MSWPGPSNKPQPKQKKKKIDEKGKTEEKTPEGSLLPPLPIGVGKSLPPTLFKEEIPPLSLPLKISKFIDGNHRKIITEDQLCVRLIFMSKSFTGIEGEPPPLSLFSPFLPMPVCTIVGNQSCQILLRKKPLFLFSFLWFFGRRWSPSAINLGPSELPVIALLSQASLVPISRRSAD